MEGLRELWRRGIHWPDWPTYLLGASAEDLPLALQRHEATGRPLGARPFVEQLQTLLGRPLLPKKRGPKPKARSNRPRS